MYNIKTCKLLIIIYCLIYSMNDCTYCFTGDSDTINFFK